MPTLKGKWYFKNQLTQLPFNRDNWQTLRLGATASITDPTGKSTTFDQVTTFIYWSPGVGLCGWGTYPSFRQNSDKTWTLYFSEGDIILWSETSGTWTQNGFRNIQFEQSVEVSEEFYNWFTKNAVPLTLEKGVWRFNKTLKNNFCIHATDSNKGGLFKFGSSGDTANHWMFDSGVESTQGYMTYGNINSTNQAIEVYNSIDGSGWVNDSYRTIEIIEPLEFAAGVSAIWFFENAFPMDLTFCSECYIAEIADTIRQIKGTTQKYPVKNLADEIITLYECANEEVY